LYHEAKLAYVQGVPFAALLCAHAACERALAGCMTPYESELPASWQRWGLGPLIAEAFKRGLIDQPLRDDLTSMNDVRRVTAHYKPPLEPKSIFARTIADSAADIQNDEELEEALESVAYADAFAAIKAAVSLLYGKQGFSRVRLY
jgi:hypothetical protein